MTAQTLMIQGASSVGRQEPADRGPLPDLRSPRSARGAVQGTKHVEQRRRLPRRIRDRPLAGDAGGRGGIEPTADMNPVLLKPEADSRSQVIVAGRPWKTLAAREYFGAREQLWPEIVAALGRLRAKHDLVIIEGQAARPS